MLWLLILIIPQNPGVEFLARLEYKTKAECEVQVSEAKLRGYQAYCVGDLITY